MQTGSVDLAETVDWRLKSWKRCPNWLGCVWNWGVILAHFSELLGRVVGCVLVFPHPPPSLPPLRKSREN